MKNIPDCIKNSLFRTIILFLLILLFIFNTIVFYSSYKEESRLAYFNYSDMIKFRLMPLFFELNSFSHGAGDDILFLSKLVNFKKDISIQSINRFTDIFINLLSQNKTYYSISFLDTTGQELFKVYQIDDSVKIADKEDLINKGLLDSFKDSLTIEPNQVSISNVQIDTLLDGSKKPVFKYTAPVFNEKNEIYAVLELVVKADYFIEDIRNFSRPNETALLINSKGMYLANNQKHKEFDNSLIYSFQSDYPGILEEILKDEKNNFIEDKNYTYSFQKIVPSLSRFNIYSGSLIGNQSVAEEYLILLVVSDKEQINRTNSSLLFSKSVIWLMQTIMIVFVIIITWRRSKK